jgi:AcrR family transcriptional regulator
VRPVEHKDESRRAAILTAATKLFAEQGFRETNLNQIAVELGFRRQAVYHYFPAKEEILYELIAAAGDAMTESSQDVFESDLSPEVAMAAIVRNHVRVVLSRADIFRVQFSELNKLTGKRAATLRDGMSDYVRRLADVIDRGQKEGIFVSSPPMTQALLIVGMCNWTTEWYVEKGSQLTIDEVADHAADLAISGLTGPSGGSRRKSTPSAGRITKTAARNKKGAATSNSRRSP